MAENALYKLTGMTDDPDLDGFSFVREESLRDNDWLNNDFSPSADDIKAKGRAWTVTPLAPIWTPQPVIGEVDPRNDYPCVDYLIPAFSRRAVDVLRDFLEPNGELLPLVNSVGEYYAYNITTVADVLDHDRSDIEWSPGKRVLARQIRRYECVPEKLAGLSIFRLVEEPGRTVVTQAFVDRVNQHRLNGFEFIRLWPLPPGVHWRYGEPDRSEDHAPAPVEDASPEATGDESPDDETMDSIQGCASDALTLLGAHLEGAEPAAVVAAVDDFAHRWQKGDRPPSDEIKDTEQARLLLGSLWGEQLLRRFGWRWARVSFSDDSFAFGVVSPDSSLAVYPFDFLLGCLANPGVDVTVALSFNMLLSGGVPAMPPRSYTDVMAGVHRIVPRD